VKSIKESSITATSFVSFATFESNLMNTKQKKQLIDWLAEEELNYDLCYNSTGDLGFGLNSPERNCSSKSKTITILKDKQGCLFGGYSPLKFQSSKVGSSFLFDFKKNM